MKRIASSILSALLTVGALAPAAAAAEPTAKVVFTGAGSARALDLSLPLLNAVPVAGGLVNDVFKGLTVGVTSTQFGSDPKASGFAIGNCGLLPANVGSLAALPVELPCNRDAIESSASDGDNGDGTAKCASNLNLGVVSLVTSCANSTSKVVDGLPLSLNEGGVATLNLGLDLKPLLGIDTAGTVNGVLALTAPVTDLLSGVIGTVNGITKPIVPIDLQKAVDDTLKQITSLNVGKLVTAQIGQATTNVASEGGITTVTSQAAGAKIGLLGITDALSDGLIIVDVSVAKAVASWNDITGQASSTATPAIATIKVKDLLDLVPGSYLVADVDLSVLNNLLAPLKNTILDSGIELASATPAQTGNNVSASTTGVGVNLLRGLGESSPGARDGGIRLRVAAANAQIAGDVVKAETVDAPLPHTGGPTTMFLALAAMLAAGAPLVFGMSRRMRKSGAAA
ncbi:MAG: hypothetical protein ACRDJO_03355 [Actinomycetota bacterium]